MSFNLPARNCSAAMLLRLACANLTHCYNFSCIAHRSARTAAASAGAAYCALCRTPERSCAEPQLGDGGTCTAYSPIRSHAPHFICFLSHGLNFDSVPPMTAARSLHFSLLYERALHMCMALRAAATGTVQAGTRTRERGIIWIQPEGAR